MSIARVSDHQLYGLAICFENYDTIYVRLFATYIAIFPALWVFPEVFVHFPLMRPFHANIRLANAHLYAHNTSPPYTCVTNKHLYYRVTESCRITGTELYCQ